MSQPELELVPIRPSLPNVIFDIRYDSENNITGRNLYNGQNEPRLARATLEKVVKAERIFNSKGLLLVIFDVYRTPEAHQALMEACPDPTYVNPKSGHMLGVSIDCGLAQKGTQKMLDLGTDYDEMSPASHIDSKDASPVARDYRLLHSGVWASVGMVQYPAEWWHQDDLETRALVEAQQR